MNDGLQEQEPADQVAERKQFNVRLGQRLREVRESVGMSQEQLADKAGLYRTYIGHLENATYNPTVYTVAKLSKAMGKELTDVLKGV